jgi:predicted permease
LLSTLAGATAPCALVAIGLFIALPRDSAAPGPIARVVVLKLLFHPLATAALLLLLPPLPPMWGKMAVLMAAMPSGATSFVLAGGAGRWAMELSAWTVMLTTCLAAATLLPILWLLGWSEPPQPRLGPLR